MNQSIIINDDHSFNNEKGVWQITAVLAGNKVTIYIGSDIKEDMLTQEIKFDWEYCIEEWLNEHEPNEDNQYYITIT